VDGNMGQHVIEETDPGRNFMLAASIEVQFDGNIGFVGFTMDACGSHKIPFVNKA
jgi:hypothetical protein